MSVVEPPEPGFDDGDWVPREGDRVTLEYPDWSKNHPRRRVGVAKDVSTEGFYVCVRPSDNLIFVSPVNYREHGATYRRWTVKDGWPVERVSQKELDAIKKNNLDHYLK